MDESLLLRLSPKKPQGATSPWKRCLGEETLSVTSQSLGMWGHFIAMPLSHLPLELSGHVQLARGRWAEPELAGGAYISLLAWEHLAIPRKQLESIAGERNVGVPQQPELIR